MDSLTLLIVGAIAVLLSAGARAIWRRDGDYSSQ